jgi:hypothetical protein
MKLNDINIEKIIRVQKDEKYFNIYDVHIDNIDELKSCDSFDFHLVLYPYHRSLFASHFTFTPYEEYVKDIVSAHRSVYHKIPENSKKVFGLLLGLLIIMSFIVYKPQSLVSVEAIVGIFAAYSFGKEIWEDIQNFFIRITKDKKISYMESYYSYQLEKKNTLTRYYSLARKNRQLKTPILPQKIDFIEQSNSQTLRMHFDRATLHSFKEKSAHLMAIHVKPKLMADFEKGGYLMGVKLSLNKGNSLIKFSREIFQSLSNQASGCLNNSDEWLENTVFYRRTFTVGRIKYFHKNGLIKNITIFDT